MNSRPPKKSDKTSVRLPPDTYIVEGLAAVSEYLRFKPEAVIELSATRELKARVAPMLRDTGLTLSIKEMAHSRESGLSAAPVQARIKLKTLTEDDLEDRLEGQDCHLVLAMDHITDPRNLGAIARSAAFFGVRELIAPERRQVLLTQASVATAQGGFAVTDIFCVKNLARSLQSLKEQGYWVIGTSMDGEPLQKVAGTYDKTILVLGNEETGISQLVRQHCDRMVAIPGRPVSGYAQGLDSLNVSVAAGILLHAFTNC